MCHALKIMVPCLSLPVDESLQRQQEHAAARSRHECHRALVAAPAPCQVRHRIFHGAVAMIRQLQERSGRGACGLRCCPRAANLLPASRLFMLFMNRNSGFSRRKVR